MKLKGNNELIQMTRRYPKLQKKILEKDGEIAKKLIIAWDIEKNPKKVLNIYLKEHHNLSDERYWELLRTVWIITGNIKNSDIFRKLMSSKRKEKYYFSTPEEAAILRGFPDFLIVYRATSSKDDNGLSWTLSKKYAKYYKTIYDKKYILEKKINKKNIFAFIERNLESEIIIL